MKRSYQKKEGFMQRRVADTKPLEKKSMVLSDTKRGQHNWAKERSREHSTEIGR